MRIGKIVRLTDRLGNARRTKFFTANYFDSRVSLRPISQTFNLTKQKMSPSHQI